MTQTVDRELLALCQRDEMIALRDRARRAAAQGDVQAGFVAAWMDQALSKTRPPAERTDPIS